MPSFFPMVAVTLEVRAKLAPKLAPRLLEAVLPTALATEAVFPNVLVIPLAIDLLVPTSTSIGSNTNKWVNASLGINTDTSTPTFGISLRLTGSS